MTHQPSSTESTCLDTLYYEKTWTANDGCSNTATWSQKIYLSDTQGPYINGPSPASKTVCADADATFGNPTYGGCQASLSSVTSTPTETDVCIGITTTKTWTVVDSCGRNATAEQTITVKDTSEPDAHCTPSFTTSNCGTIDWSSPEHGATCDVDCNGNPTTQTCTVTEGVNSVTKTCTCESQCGTSGDSCSITASCVTVSCCTYTQGYWKNHEESWPSNPAPTTDFYECHPYTWMTVLTTPPSGNAVLISGKQYVAAYLNGLQNGCDPSVVTITIDDEVVSCMDFLRTYYEGTCAVPEKDSELRQSRIAYLSVIQRQGLE